jgi:hypothetical protein
MAYLLRIRWEGLPAEKDNMYIGPYVTAEEARADRDKYRERLAPDVHSIQVRLLLPPTEAENVLQKNAVPRPEGEPS